MLIVDSEHVSTGIIDSLITHFACETLLEQRQLEIACDMAVESVVKSLSYDVAVE